MDTSLDLDKAWWEHAEKASQKPLESRTTISMDTFRSYLGRKALLSNDGSFLNVPGVKSKVDLESGSMMVTEPEMKSTLGMTPQPAPVYAASWANMLESFERNLSLFEFSSPNRATDSLLFCDTEYIPNDLPAAPAIGNVETIVKMAALAGCEMISFPWDEEYPVVRGSNMELAFREHPRLGVIADFRRFPGPETYQQ